MIKRSQRLDQIPPYLFTEIAAIKARLQKEGKEIIDFGIGDPDRPTPRPIIEALYQAALEPWTHRYDESPFGVPAFLEAAAEWYTQEFGVSLDPHEEVLLLIGSKEGLAHLVWTYADPGDVVLVPDPGYPVYRVNALMAGAEIYPLPLLAQNGFLPDLDAIPSSVLNRAKLMFLNYPNNPTGAVADLAFFEKAVALAHRYQFLLVNDFAYGMVCYDGFRHPSLLQVAGAKEVAIEFHSLSKMFNMTGWRIGFAIGNRAVLSNLAKLKSNLDSKQFPAIAMAAAYALRYVSNEETFRLYQHRRDRLVAGLQSLGWQVSPPKATFYVWVPVPDGSSSTQFAQRLLEEAQVLAIPGIGYGQHGEGYLRFSLTIPGDQQGERIEEALHRIRRSALSQV